MHLTHNFAKGMTNVFVDHIIPVAFQPQPHEEADSEFIYFVGHGGIFYYFFFVNTSY